jgi:hypothetical protein
LAQPVILTSFGAGEISPNLFARVDLDKYHVGAALLLNFFVDYRGGASTRAGTKFLGRPGLAAGKTAVQLKKFDFSTIQSYLLIFTHQKLRFLANQQFLSDATLVVSGVTRANPGVITFTTPPTANKFVTLSAIVGMTQLNGRTFQLRTVVGNTAQLFDEDGVALDTSGYTAYVSGGSAAQLYELATPYVEADIGSLKFTQSADVLTITNQNYVPYDLTRSSVNSFTLTATVFGPKIGSPTGLTGAISTDQYIETVRYGYTVTAISADGLEESLPEAPYITVISSPLSPVPLDFSNAHGPALIKLNWNGVSGATTYRVYKWGPVDQYRYASPDDTVFGYIGTCYGTCFTDNNIAPDFSRTPPSFFNPFAPGQILSMALTAGFPAHYVGQTGDHTTNAGGITNVSYQPLTITGDGTGATGYAVADPQTGAIVAVVLLTGGKNYTTATATSGAHTLVCAFTFAPLTGVNPACCGYFQQRRCYADTVNNPQTIYLSQIANFVNFDESLVGLASDAITITLSSREVNAIEHLVSMSTGLVVFTTGGAFLVSGGSPQAAIKPDNIVALPQASTGANHLPPIPVNQNILFVSNKSTTVRDLAFNFYVQTYYGFDRSVMAAHLFSGHTLTSWCYAEEPSRTIWAVREDGVLLCLTYVPEQEVYAWSHHTTDGTFLACESVSSATQDEVYFAVVRDGKTLIEVQAPRPGSTVTDLRSYWTVDCGLHYSGPPITVVGNLWHLVGKTVTGLAAGIVIPPQVVSAAGTITLGAAASVITVGLPFTAQLQTLNLDTGDPTIQSKYKQLTGLTVRLENTLGLKAGPSFSRLQVMKDLVQVNATVASDDARALLAPEWNTKGQVCIQQDLPLPATVLGLIPEVTLGSTGR